MFGNPRIVYFRKCSRQLKPAHFGRGGCVRDIESIYIPMRSKQQEEDLLRALCSEGGQESSRLFHSVLHASKRRALSYCLIGNCLSVCWKICVCKPRVFVLFQQRGSTRGLHTVLAGSICNFRKYLRSWDSTLGKRSQRQKPQSLVGHSQHHRQTSGLFIPKACCTRTSCMIIETPRNGVSSLGATGRKFLYAHSKKIYLLFR